MNLRRFWWAAGIVLVLVATYLCLTPRVPISTPFQISDLLNHFVGHGVLAIYFAGLVTRARWWLIFVFLLLFGVAVEFAQYSMNVGRHGEFRDVVANAGGAVLGLLVARLGLYRWPDWAARLLGRQAA